MRSARPNAAVDFLAGAGVNDEKALLDGLAGDLFVLHDFSLRHLGAMAFGIARIDLLGHGVSFTASGSPATIKTTREALAAIR